MSRDGFESPLASSPEVEFLDVGMASELRAAGRLTVGRHTYGGPYVWWWGEDVRLDIGSFCSIAADVTLVLGGNHRLDWVTTYPFSVLPVWPEVAHVDGHPGSRGDINIGNDVWLGYGATVLSGVTIGDGAVVGAHSVVTRDVDPYAVAVGNPARVVRQRFAPEVVAALLRVRWWEWTESRIRRQLPRMLTTDVAAWTDRHDPNPEGPSRRAPNGPPGQLRRWHRRLRRNSSR